MKILITGGCGFVGSNLAIFLKKRLKNTFILSVDNLIRKGSLLNEKRLKKLKIYNKRIDVSNYNKIKTLKKFDLHSPTIGSDAQGEVTVNVEHEGQSYRGSGTSVDIVEAGSRAYLGVINRIIRREKQGIKSAPQNNNIHRAPI